MAGDLASIKTAKGIMTFSPSILIMDGCEMNTSTGKPGSFSIEQKLPDGSFMEV